MNPTSVVGFLFFLGVLLPGIAWLWVSERRGLTSTRPAAVAIAELAVVGIVAATLAFAAVAFLGGRTSWLVDVPAWLRHGDGADYLASHLFAVLLSFGLQVVLSTGLAAGAAAVIHRQTRTAHRPGGSVLHQVFETDRNAPAQKSESSFANQAWVAVQTSDGTVVEGYLRCFPADRNDVFLAVESPIFVYRARDGEKRVETDSDRIVVNMNLATLVAIRYGDAPETPDQQ